MHNLTITEYENIRVLSTQQLADAYETDIKTISNNFNRNKDRYEPGKHYFCLDGEELRNFKGVHQNDESLAYVSKLYLWTEKGVLLHAKSLNTDKAWDVYEYLVDNYFKKRQNQTIDRTALSPQMQALIALTDGMARQELEQKRQAEQLIRIEKKQDTIVETFSDTTNGEDFKAWVNRCISRIAESPKYTNGSTRSVRYQNVRSESYDRLNQKRACRLTQRVAYAKEMALQNGATKTVANSINRLTIISSDKDLKPIYETVIKEMMICYCVEVA